MTPLSRLLFLCTLLTQMLTLSLAAPSNLAVSVKAPVEYSGFAAILQVLSHLPGLKARICANRHISLEMESLAIMLDRIQGSHKAIRLNALAEGLLGELEYDAIIVDGENPMAIFNYLLTDCLSWMAESFFRTITIGELPFSPRSDSIQEGTEEIPLDRLEYLVVNVAPTADMAALGESLNYEMFSKTDSLKLEVVILKAVHSPHSFSVLVRRNVLSRPGQWLYLNGPDTNFVGMSIDDQLPNMMLNRYQVVMLFYAKPLKGSSVESSDRSEFEPALDLDDGFPPARSSDSFTASGSWKFWYQ